MKLSPYQLHDLESLITTVRADESKRLIAEAVRAYNGGALRAAIMSTWVALCADIIEKLRELAAMGEAVAKKHCDELDKFIKNNDVKSLQQFEGDLLKVATDELEILSSHERDQLERLSKDRNLCAHPAFVSEEEGILFSPSPEIARAHIVHAILLLLSRAPVQGKTLIARLDKDILGGTFPKDDGEIQELLDKSYLAAAREGAIGSIIKCLLKALIGDEKEKYKEHSAAISKAFAAIGRIRPDLFEQIVPEFAKKLGKDLEGAALLRLSHYLGSEPRIWEWIEEGQMRFLAKIESAQKSELGPAFHGRGIPEIGASLLKRLESSDLEYTEWISILGKWPCRAFVPKVLDLYCGVGSFQSAHSVGSSVVLAHAEFLDANDLATIIEGFKGNSQISEAALSSDIFIELFDRTSSMHEAAKDSWKDLSDYISNSLEPEHYTRKELIQKIKGAGLTD